MTTAEGTTAIAAALAEELADFGKKRATQTPLSPDDSFDVNTDLATKIQTRLLTDLDAAWSD